MVNKLKFNLLGDLENNPRLLEVVDGEYEAPTEGQLPHRFKYDVTTDSILDVYGDISDFEVRQKDHEAAIALATELGMPLPPPLV
jgi:hypothetical protein